MIEAKDITYAYGRRQVLNGACLTAMPGQCVGIVGANGCGKSTLLCLLAGARKPQGGSCHIQGEDAFKNRKLFTGRVGYVPQEDSLIEELTVLDNLRLWYGSKSMVAQAMEHGFLSVLKLKELLSRSVSQLSGGQKKRVSIGCAMAAEPKLLILDEPSAALDLVCKEEIRNYLRIYLKHGGTIIMATHEEAELDLCSRLYAMCDGRLTEVSPGLRGQELVDVFTNDNMEE